MPTLAGWSLIKRLRSRAADFANLPDLLTKPMSTPDRRFPLPWSIEERQACFIVKDGNGQALAYVYFEEEPGRRSAENLMSHDEAGALALNIAKLPELLCKKVD
jgi:hypothetical protein